FTGPAAPVVFAAGAYTFAAGAGWMVGHTVGNMIVRGTHNQSNGFDNPAAVADYVTLGATALLGVGAFVRPVAMTAAGAVMRGSATVAFTGMYGYSFADYQLNKHKMTPGQRADAQLGLWMGGAMLLTP